MNFKNSFFIFVLLSFFSQQIFCQQTTSSNPAASSWFDVVFKTAGVICMAAYVGEKLYNYYFKPPAIKKNVMSNLGSLTQAVSQLQTDFTDLQDSYLQHCTPEIDSMGDRIKANEEKIAALQKTVAHQKRTMQKMGVALIVQQARFDYYRMRTRRNAQKRLA